MSNNKNFTAAEIISQINVINEIFRDSRAYYPYIRDEDIGRYSARPFNGSKNIITIHYEDPITKEFQISNNKIAHFLNQNFLIRLFSTLQYYGVYDSFDKDKNPELYALKLLRNEFVHSLGAYNSGSPKDKKIMGSIIKSFGLENKEYSEFPVSIDTVIGKIITASIQFIKEHYS